MTMTEIQDIGQALADQRCLIFFKYVAGGVQLAQPPELSNKKYYSALSKLKRANLITKDHGQYQITPFGQVIKQALDLIGKAIESKPQLIAWNAIQKANNISPREKRQLLEMLIPNEQVRGILGQC